MISYEASLKQLELLSINPLATEKIFLSDALGRILAEDIIASENSPIAPTSAMDGYAIKVEDQLLGRIQMLEHDNPAGAREIEEVLPGFCLKTFTGSLMPEGADALIPIENVTVENSAIVINTSVEEGFAVRPIAESFSKGQVLIKRGTKIGFAEVGVMASLNVVMAPVVIQPRVGVLSTGSEVLDLGEQATHASQIRSSNNYTLAALSTQSGALTQQLGVVKDDKASITKAFLNALDASDIVVTTGGVSVGDYDFVKDIIPELGAEVVFKGVSIKPGQHIMLAQKGNKFIVALPGFAYSSTVTFILYVLPIIARLLGQKEVVEVVEATLTQDFNKRAKKTEFTACNIHFNNGRYEVDFVDKKIGSSAILTNMLGVCALLMTGETDSNLSVGEKVKVLNLQDL